MNKLAITICVLFALSGCEQKRTNIVSEEDILIKITEIDPPKHYRVYGSEVTKDGLIGFAKYKIYSARRCSNVAVSVGDLVKGKKILFTDGDISLETTKDQVCN